MRWKHAILKGELLVTSYGRKEFYPKGTPVLIGGEEFVQNKMVWQILLQGMQDSKMRKTQLYVDKDDVLLCSKEEIKFAKFLLNIT